MKKLKKLAIKKVTLRHLDEFTLDAVAGATGSICPNTVPVTSCDIQRSCAFPKHVVRLPAGLVLRIYFLDLRLYSYGSHRMRTRQLWKSLNATAKVLAAQ